MADTKQTEASKAANNNDAQKKPLQKKIIKRPATAPKAAAASSPEAKSEAKMAPKAPAKKTAAKKSAAKKTVKKKTAPKKTTTTKAKKTVSKKTTAKKTTAKKTTAKKATPKKTAAKKTTVKKAATKKSVAKKTPPKKVAKKKAPVKKAAPKKAAKTAPKSATKIAANTSIFNVQPQILEIVKMTKAPFQFDQLAQEATEAGREGFEAFVKSGTIFAKGFEDLIKTAANLSQDAAEKQAEFAKQLMSSKTLNEFAETQNKIAQANFDQFMSGATKLSEMSVKVLSEGSEPINAQLNKTMQKANKAMAA